MPINTFLIILNFLLLTLVMISNSRYGRLYDAYSLWKSEYVRINEDIEFLRNNAEYTNMKLVQIDQVEELVRANERNLHDMRLRVIDLASKSTDDLK